MRKMIRRLWLENHCLCICMVQSFVLMRQNDLALYMYVQSVRTNSRNEHLPAADHFLLEKTIINN